MHSRMMVPVFSALLLDSGSVLAAEGRVTISSMEIGAMFSNASDGDRLHLGFEVTTK